LPEFAKAAALRSLAPPHRPHVVALERGAELGNVLGGEAGERDGQVETQRDVSPPFIGKAEELLVSFRPPLAQKNFRVFQGGGVGGGIAVGAVAPPRLGQ